MVYLAKEKQHKHWRVGGRRKQPSFHSQSFSLTVSLSFSPSPLITFHMISISVILFLFQLFVQLIFVFWVQLLIVMSLLLFYCSQFLIFYFLDNISYNKGLVMMNSFNSTLSEKHFICPSILNDSFAGYSNLGCRSLPFMTSNTSFQPLLACKVSFEKSDDTLRGTPLQVTASFSLAASKIFSFCVILGNVIMMCLGVFLLGSNFSGTL